MAPALRGIPFLLLPIDTHKAESGKPWNSSSFQSGSLAWKRSACGVELEHDTHVHAWCCAPELSAVSKCPHCTQLVPNIDERCTSASVCVQVCAGMTPGSDRLRLSVEISRLQRAFSAYPRHWTHTNTRMQWSFQGVAAVCSLSLGPGGAARLTKPDWQCQELRVQRLDLHKNFELLQKCLFEGGKSLSVQ